MKKPWVIMVWFKKSGSDVELMANAGAYSAKTLQFKSKKEAIAYILDAPMPKRRNQQFMKAVKM